MSTSLRLPPSGRDYRVYQRVVVDGASTWKTAEELKISQTRVRQIVRRVAEWLRSCARGGPEQAVRWPSLRSGTRSGVRMTPGPWPTVTQTGVPNSSRIEWSSASTSAATF